MSSLQNVQPIVDIQIAPQTISKLRYKFQFINKNYLWLNLFFNFAQKVDDWTTERAIIATNENDGHSQCVSSRLKFQNQKFYVFQIQNILRVRFTLKMSSVSQGIVLVLVPSGGFICLRVYLCIYLFVYYLILFDDWRHKAPSRMSNSGVFEERRGSVSFDVAFFGTDLPGVFVLNKLS